MIIKLTVDFDHHEDRVDYIIRQVTIRFVKLP